MLHAYFTMILGSRMFNGKDVSRFERYVVRER
jgi:hypothetical protein